MEDFLLFLCGDVMTGRGIDQILPYSNEQILHERYVKNARDYVKLAEEAHGSIPRQADFSYVWGVAMAELDERQPAARIINLETSVTDSDNFLDVKGIHYRMHPDNTPCLTEAGIDVCNLANNHVLDFGPEGLRQTLRTLENAELATTGAGNTRNEAKKPAIVPLKDDRRLLVFGACESASGVPESWSAGEDQPGVNYLPDLSESTAQTLSRTINGYSNPSDRVILSIHWGGNWGYGIPEEQRSFARTLIDNGAVDLIHGHSSHHVKGLEIYDDRLIFYGCGDFITDYEGISGHEKYRDDLGLMYFPAIDSETGKLRTLTMIPTKLRNFSLLRPDPEEVKWLTDLLNRESTQSGGSFTRTDSGEIELQG